MGVMHWELVFIWIDTDLLIFWDDVESDRHVVLQYPKLDFSRTLHWLLTQFSGSNLVNYLWKAFV